MNYIDKLIASCHQAKAAQPIQTIVITEGTDLAALNGIQNGVYVFEEINGNPQQTFEALDRYKKSGDRNCPQLNKACKVMYVGSSRTGVKGRIEQHIGNGPKSTYALHLSHWFTGEYKITVTQYDVPNEVLQILEDDQADRLEPAFGKRGGNNR
jgi:hypothetical protein